METLPPGVDEAVAISRVVQLAKSPEYSGFTRIVFDTAPTGHTLRLLTLPEFLDATIGTISHKQAQSSVLPALIMCMFCRREGGQAQTEAGRCC